MENFIGAFQPLWELELKLVCFVLFLSLVGWSAVQLTARWRGGEAASFPWLLSLPLGFAIVATPLFVVVRVLELTKAPHFAIASGVAAFCAAVVVVLAFAGRLMALTRMNLPRIAALVGLTIY